MRYLKKNIDTKMKHDTSTMLNGCSKKRPDIYYELDKHCVIVEIDEHQHKSYSEICECARINEIVSPIGGKSVIFIRYNPDKITNNGKVVEFSMQDRLDILIEIIKSELIKNYDQFCIKIIQLFYDDNYELYELIKEENITDKVAV